MFGNETHLAWAADAYASVMAHCLFHTLRSGQAWLLDVDMRSGANAHSTVWALAAFWPGLQVLAGACQAWGQGAWRGFGAHPGGGRGSQRRLGATWAGPRTSQASPASHVWFWGLLPGTCARSRSSSVLPYRASPIHAHARRSNGQRTAAAPTVGGGMAAVRMAAGDV